jgi:hypothetical protein
MTVAELTFASTDTTKGYEDALKNMQAIPITSGSDEEETARFAIEAARSILDTHEARRDIPSDTLTGERNLLESIVRDFDSATAKH